MNKLFPLFFLIIFLCIPLTILAKPIDQLRIGKVAKFWIRQNAVFREAQRKNNSSPHRIRAIYKVILDQDELPAFAVELEPSGYLIISADDNLPVVLAYSQNSQLNLFSDRENGFRNLLKRDLQMAETRLGKGQTEKIKKYRNRNQQLWKKILDESAVEASLATDVSPLAMDAPLNSTVIVDELLQTRWSQSRYYNALTPVSYDAPYGYDDHVPTGCVATAYAQLMKYYNWPWFGRGTHRYTDSEGFNQGTYIGDFSDRYDWANMKSFYDYNMDEPADEVAAVAELMSEIGIASEVNYEAEGSTASFDFHGRIAAQFYYHQSPYISGSASAMNDVLIAEIGKYLPCVVSIPGHAVVVDGHSINGDDHFFHINFGWGGTNDGWYLIGGIPGGGIDYVFPGNYPRPVPLVETTGVIGGRLTLSWQFPEFYPNPIKAVRLYQGSMQHYDLLQDTADNFFRWERAEGDSSLWMIENGMFHWQKTSLYNYSSLQVQGPIIPSTNTQLSFDLRTILGDETLSVEISTDNGLTWDELRQWTDTGWNGDLTRYSVDLSAYAETESLIRFKATYESGNSWTDGGVWLDNIELTECQGVDFQEKNDGYIENMPINSVDIFNLSEGKTFYRLEVMSDNVWSEKSPVVNVSLQCNDEDSDNDGVKDCIDFCPNDNLNDADNDGVCFLQDECPDDGQKVVSGICGCGISDIDTDSDGVVDCQDAFPNDPDQWIITPLNDTTAFVQQVYQDFLARDADTGGLAYWVDAIDNQGVPRAQLVEGFLDSAEFGQTVSPVTRLYFAYFNRIPDYSGLMYWIDSYAQGATLATVSDAFAGSAEFTDTYGSLDNSAFVTLVYQNVLGRDPDSGGLTHWTGVLDRSEQTRGQVMIGFSESTEYQELMASPIYVTMTYIGLLRRAPDQGGFDYWVNVMDSGGSGLALIEGFLTSGEYAARF